MSFKQLFDPETSTLTYILMDPVTKQAIIIDPVFGQERRDLAELEAMDAALAYIAETHVHADHVTGARIIKETTNCQFISGQDSGITCGDRLMGDGDSVSFGDEVLYSIKTPGHTSGCTSYQWRDRLFTGDTLLIGGCGRTDFQQGDAGKLFDSLTYLLSYPDETLVYPAHDYNGYRVSNVVQEKLTNDRIKDRTRDNFIENMNSLDLPNPAKIDIAVPANLVCGNDDRGVLDTRIVEHSA